MAIDTSIYNNLLRPVKSVEDYNNEAMQQKQNRLALLVSQRQSDDYTRERAAENKLAELLTAGGTPDQIGADLARSGFAKQALAYTKQQQDLAKGKADVAHVTAQTGKLTSETGKIDFEQREAKRQKAISDIAAFTDPQQALASLALHEQAGDLAPEAAAAVRATIPQNPADFPKWQVSMLQRIMSAKDAAGQIAPDANARLSSETQVKTNAATNARAASDAAAGRAQADRHFNTREAREAAAPKGQVIQTDDGPMLVDPRSGTAKPVTANGQALAPKLKSLPAPIQKALLENDASLRKVDKALAAIDTHPDALGAANYLGDTIRQRTDPKGVEARALVADIGSLKIHDRSGAAVTASETPRLKPFIPAATDDIATVKKKLGLFRQEYEAIQSDINNTYTREQGYRPPSAARPAAGAAPAQAYADPEKERRYQEWKRSQGK